MVKMVPRGFTATADAYLTPHIMRCAVTSSSIKKNSTGEKVNFVP